jgi:hypothetical protein
MKKQKYTFEVPAGQITVDADSPIFVVGNATLTIDEVAVDIEFTLELDARDRWRIGYWRVYPQGFDLLSCFTRGADGQIDVASDRERAEAELAKANETVRLGVPKTVAADAYRIIEVAVSSWIVSHPLEMQAMAGPEMRRTAPITRREFLEAAEVLRDGALRAARACFLASQSGQVDGSNAGEYRKLYRSLGTTISQLERVAGLMPRGKKAPAAITRAARETELV